MNNIFDNIPKQLPNEILSDIINTPHLRVERIVSKGHRAPDKGWYDQEENEWVMVLSGFGIIEFSNGETIRLAEGDYVDIKAHQKHRVIETAIDKNTVWLAIFY